MAIGNAMTGLVGEMTIDGSSVASVRNFTLEQTGEVITATAMGDVFATKFAGVKDATATADLYYDNDHLTDIVSALQDRTQVTLVLFPGGPGTDTVNPEHASITANAFVVSYNVTSSVDNVVEASVEFAITGQPTFAEV